MDEMDISSFHILREIVCFEKCRSRRSLGESDLRVYTVNHVTHRVENAWHSDTLWLSNDGAPMPSSPCMIIRLHSSDEEKVSKVQGELPRFRWLKKTFRGEQCAAFDTELLSTVHISYSSDHGVYLE